ncbi:hypothetical protein Glove_13g103 [Diversispora epigaea]|uniref:Uncharacterized protein n=1 Tax=Diversispora epigaea TaxID=1348612 RepID=A0A397JXP4_9GLOM|nr:hypothetical protein Glove_13g103 [Diversispora epigaea]
MNQEFQYYQMVQKDVKYLYGGIFNSRGERIQLCDDNLDELCLENFERLREIMSAIIYKAIEELTKCIELLSQEVSRLQELYAYRDLS